MASGGGERVTNGERGCARGVTGTAPINCVYIGYPNNRVRSWSEMVSAALYRAPFPQAEPFPVPFPVFPARFSASGTPLLLVLSFSTGPEETPAS